VGWPRQAREQGGQAQQNPVVGETPGVQESVGKKQIGSKVPEKVEQTAEDLEYLHRR